MFASSRPSKQFRYPPRPRQPESRHNDNERTSARVLQQPAPQVPKRSNRQDVQQLNGVSPFGVIHVDDRSLSRDPRTTCNTACLANSSRIASCKHPTRGQSLHQHLGGKGNIFRTVQSDPSSSESANHLASEPGPASVHGIGKHGPGPCINIPAPPVGPSPLTHLDRPFHSRVPPAHHPLHSHFACEISHPATQARTSKGHRPQPLHWSLPHPLRDNLPAGDATLPAGSASGC